MATGISSCDMTRTTIRIYYPRLRCCVLTLGMAVAIGGCGYKGPLYLPPAKVDAAKPLPIPAPGPDRPVPGESAPPPQ
jgi:predicted small lipoprotein YifL